MAETNEKILNKCYQLYAGNNGLTALGKELNLEITAPSKQVSILLLGNHSAGKSSFINWYVGDTIQKAGVAVETQGFTFVRHGRRRESFLAEAALLSMRQFHELETIEGLADFLTMEISPSQLRNFPLVTFIDSPGLVDGGIKYPYDVEKTLLTLGKVVDLIFVFFDPVGQALCKRTLAVVHKLMQVRKEGIVFLLSKVDEAGHHGDRQKVIVQIVQELSTCTGYNRQGFDIKSIHIPGLEKGKDDFNQIEELCDEINKAVGFTVQRTLNRLGHDRTRMEIAVHQSFGTSQFQCTLPAQVFLMVILATVAFMIFSRTTRLQEIIILGTSLILFVHYSRLRTILSVSNYLKHRKLKRCIANAISQYETLYFEYLQNI